MFSRAHIASPCRLCKALTVAGPLAIAGKRALRWGAILCIGGLVAAEASWRNGYAEDCKSFYPGSIPGEASNLCACVRSRQKRTPWVSSPLPSWSLSLQASYLYACVGDLFVLMPHDDAAAPACSAIRIGAARPGMSGRSRRHCKMQREGAFVQFISFTPLRRVSASTPAPTATLPPVSMSHFWPSAR